MEWPICPPRSISLYNDRASPSLDLSEVARFLAGLFPHAAVACRGDILDRVRQGLAPEARAEHLRALARRFAAIKVRRIEADRSFEEPIEGEIRFEERRLADPSVRAAGILYDGFELQAIAAGTVPMAERRMDHAHIAVTNRLFGTFDSDGRYHARTILCGLPSLVSTTGLVEAPAKPREFYVEKQALVAAGMAGEAVESLKEKYRGRFLEKDDPNMTDVIKGYALQAVFWSITGDPFCPNQACRRFNSHWQAELLAAQRGEPGLCDSCVAVIAAASRTGSLSER